jgi:hypothetical protein
MMRRNQNAKVLAPLFAVAFLSCGCEEINSGYTYGPGAGGSRGTASYSPGGDFVYGPQSTSRPSPEEDYNRALTEYNSALTSYNNASTVGALQNANWSIQQNSAPGLGKAFAFGGMVAGNANRDDAARQVEVARQRLEAARQRLTTQGTTTQPATPPRGRVSIVAVPENAEVRVDSKPAGNSPCTLSLPEGLHDFQIFAPGYKASSRSVAVIPDSEMTLKVTLDRNE